MKKLLFIISILSVYLMPNMGWADTSVSQFGITWTFDKDYEVGQFANGDYWVFGPVNIISIDPPCHITVDGEQDEDGVDYNSYQNVTGIGAWAITENWYRHTTIYTSDTSNLTVGQTLLINGTTGDDSSLVNGYAGTVEEIYADRFVLSFHPVRWDLTSTSDISGGTFGGRIINGSEINPLSTANTQAYTSAAFGYTHSENVAWSISAYNPDREEYLVVPVNSSLISTSGRVADPYNKSVVNRAQILTVLPQGAFNGMIPSECFRPHYFGDGSKSILHCTTNMDDYFLGNLALIAEYGAAKPTLDAMIDQFARPWIRRGKNHTSRYIHPFSNMPDYYFQIQTNNAARVLNSSDYTLAQKQPLLINYVQLGIDLFGQYVEGSHGNGPDGGVYTGLMLPMLAFGRAFNYQPVWDMFAKAGDYRYSAKPNTNPVDYYSDGDLPPDYNFVQELCQTFYITQRDVDVTNNLFRGEGEYLEDIHLWRPDIRTAPNYPYTVNMIGIPEWGIRQSTDPSQSDAAFPQSNYRGLNSVRYPHMQLMVLVWGLKERVNHNAWFDYTDRWASYWAAIDDTQHTRTWSAYRADYGPIWMPGDLPDNPDTDNPEDPGNLSDQNSLIPEKTELKLLNNILKGSNAQATIKLMMAEPGNATVKIYDSKGREIITLWEGHKDAGEYPFPWAGVDSGGSKVGSGIYMVHMKSGSYSKAKKIAVIK